METMLERIKDRVNEKDSPIKSVKSLADAVGMSEGGFYSMVKRGTTKVKTLEAICNALGVPNDYFDSNGTDKKLSDLDFGDNALQVILHDIQEMKQVFEDQLKAKDKQIDGLQRMLESVLGKSEGVTDEPLSLFAEVTLDMLKQYRATVLEQVVGKEPVKKTNKHKSKVGGTQFSQAENALITR